MKRTLSLVIDRTSCDGRGLCAELFPERIGLDPWGYPIVDGDEIPPTLLEHARRAARSCPLLALHLVEGRR